MDAVRASTVCAHRAWVLALFILTLSLAPQIRAEQQAGNSGPLEEIIVTAQKRAQNSQDVGISISALSGADLSAVGATLATDVTRSTPAVILTQPNGPSSFSLSIRGVTQNDFADHQESPAAVYVDDAYVSQMAGLAFQLFDIDRVEILRGPQGTLFGRNATSGLAHFISRRPTDEADGYTSVTLGERNLTRIEGAVGGPLADGVSGRVAFESNHYDPLFKNKGGGGPDLENGNDWAVRGQLLFKLGERAQLLTIARLAREDVHAGAWESRPSYFPVGTINAPEFVPGNLDAWGTGAGRNALGYAASGDFTSYGNANGFAKLRTSGLTGNFSYDFGAAKLAAIADYQTIRKDYAEDSDTTPLNWFQFFNGSDVRQKSAEVRLNGTQGALTWTTGIYYLDIDGKYYEGNTGPVFWQYETGNAWPYGTDVPGGDGATPVTLAPYDLRTKSSAAFGQLEYKLSERVSLTGGARFSTDRKDYTFSWAPSETFYGQAPTVSVPSPIVAGAWTNYAGSLDDHFWSGKAQLDFHLTSDVLLYAGFNRGVKAGGFNAPLLPYFVSDTTLLPFKPETLDSYELGYKSLWFDRRLRVNGAVYYYDYKDFQALVFTQGVNQLIRNADARHVGAELEIEAAPTEALHFGLGVAYIDAIVKQIDARGTGSLADFVPGNAPRWSGNALARYTWPAGAGKLSLQLDGNFLTKFYFNIADTQIVTQGGYALANLRLNYTNHNEKLEVGAELDNLANKHYAVMAFDLTGIDGITQLYPGAPRWAKVHVNYRL